MLDKNDFQKVNLSKDEEAIAKAINLLKYHDPENATRENAISYLEYMFTAAEWASKQTDLTFDDFYEKYKAEQAKKSGS